MKLKRILSLFLGLMLVISSCFVVSAKDTGNAGEVSNDRANVSYVYIGRTEGLSTKPTDITAKDMLEDVSATQPLKVGDVIWVGVQFSNMSKVRDLFQSDSTDASAGGLKNIVTGFTFDSEYLKLDKDYLDSNTYEGYGDVMYSLVKPNYPSNPTNQSSFYGFRSGTLQIINGVSSNDHEVTHFEDVETAKTATYTIASTGAAPAIPRMFKDNVHPFESGTVGDTDVMMSVFAFEIEKIPENGAKVLQGAIGFSTFSLGGGYSGTAPSAAWNVDQGSNSDNNLKNYFNVTDKDGNSSDGTINLFPNKYTVHYNLGDGGSYTGTETDWNDKTIGEGQTVAEANILPDSKKLSKTGNVFAGWYLDENFNASSVKFDENTVAGDSLATNGIINVYAKWEPGYKITVDPNDGVTASTVLEYPQSQTAFKEADKPVQPTRTGYIFKGWNTKQNGTGTPVTQSQLEAYTFDGTTTPEYEFYAQWQTDPDDSIADVTVTFDGNGVDVENNPTTDKEPNPKTITINSGDVILAGNMPDEPTRDGYTFNGWNTKANGTGNAFTGGNAANGGITENMTVYAQWNVAENETPAVVTFRASDTDVTTPPNPTSITVKAGDSIGEVRMPDVPVRTGYVFAGWESAPGVSFTYDTPVPSNMTVDATWKASATIRFYANKSMPDTTPIKEVEVAKDEAVPAEVIPKDVENEGYVLLDWNTQANGGGADLTGFEVKGDTDFYALWQAVKTDDEGNPTTPVAPADSAVTVNFDVNCANDANATVKPAVRYLKSGDTKLADVPTDMPTAKRPKYTLKGWYTTPGGTGTPVTKDTVLTPGTDNTVTLYAQWEADANAEGFDPQTDKIITVRTHKKIGDAAVLTPAYQVVAGQKLGFAFDEPENPGLTLAGWVTFNGTTGEDPAAIPFDPTTEVVSIDNATEEAGSYYYDVYATWSAESATVTLENTVVTYNGESQGARVTTITIGGEDATAFFDADDYVVTYTQQGVAGATPTTAPTEAGTYDISITFVNDDITVDVIESATEEDENTTPVFIINKAPVAFSLADGTTQSVKTSAPDTDRMLKLAAKATLIKNDASTEEKTLTQGTDFSVEYYKLADVSNPEVPANATWNPSIDAGIGNIGDYVARIVVSNTNYQVGSLDSAIKHYGESVDPVVNASKMKFTVTPDIELNGLLIADSTVTDFTNPDNLKQLYNANTLADDAKTNFVPATHTYYVSADVDENIKIQFNGTFGDDTTVTLQKGTGTPEDISPKADGKPVAGTTDEIVLAAADGTAEGGFNNTIVIKLNGEASTPDQIYTIYVRQLVQAKIVLNPGNSPYGMIEKMAEKYHGAEGAWSTEKIAKAKEVFKNSDADYGNLKFGSDEVMGSLVPDNAQNTLPYTAVAWGEGTNYDMVAETIFVYENQKFLDPGFTIYDQTGAEVTNAVVNRHTVLRKQLSGALPKYDGTGVEDFVIDANGSSQYLFEEISNNMIIEPDVYELKYTYTYTDEVTKENKVLEIVRPLIVLAQRGDVELTPIPGFNNNDATELMNNFLSIGDLNKLFAYRTCDIEITPIPGLNNNDATELMNNFLSGFDQYYTSLPSEIPSGL